MPPNLAPVAAKIATANGGSIATGMWTLVFLAAVGLATAIIKQWGPWQTQAATGRNADFVRLRAEIETAKKEAKDQIATVRSEAKDEIAEIKKDAKEARDEARRVSDIAQRLENMVACMRPAISILRSEVERLDPDNPSNPALLQVRDLMAMAAAGDLGGSAGASMVALATVKGVGE